MSFAKLSPEELRKHKGKSFVGVATIFFCHDGAGKLFMVKRSQKTRDEQGRWEFGGGGLKWGQTAEENMRREVVEEYGTNPLEVEFMGYRDCFRNLEDGTPTHWLIMDYLVRLDPSEVAIQEPEFVDDSGWFRLGEFPSPVHSQIGEALDKYGDLLRLRLTV